jgi:hypothetical protein
VTQFTFRLPSVEGAILPQLERFWAKSYFTRQTAVASSAWGGITAVSASDSA